MGDRIIKFIEHFRGSEYTFLYGCCYWFAVILAERFREDCPAIMYEPVRGHFVTRIGDRYYDVRGDVTEMYQYKQMYDMDRLRDSDSSYYRHLMRDCRNFEVMDE